MDKKELFEKYILQNIDSAYRFAYIYVKNVEDAEDVVNESVVKAINSLHTLRKPEYIKAWFYKIISNTAVSLLRTKKRFVHLSEACFEGAEEDYSDISFNSIIEKLHIKYREIIVLRFLENMTLQEISDALGVNVNTVKTRLYKGLEILKADMEEEI